MTNLVEIEGKPIIDAKRPIKFWVTRADRRKGDTARDAVARACSREVGESRVYLTRIYVLGGRRWRRYVLPSAVMRDTMSEPCEVVLNPMR